MAILQKGMWSSAECNTKRVGDPSKGLHGKNFMQLGDTPKEA